MSVWRKSVVSVPGNSVDGAAERDRRVVERFGATVDVPVERGVQADSDGHAVGDVVQRAQRVTDGVGDAGAAVVDGHAGQERGLLHRLTCAQVGRIGRRREAGVRRRGRARAGRTPQRPSCAGRPSTPRGRGRRHPDPVPTVTACGIVAAAVGSSTTRSGSISSPHVHIFRPARSLTMQVRVTSAPVPDVVGMATIGPPSRQRRRGTSRYGSTPVSPTPTVAACLAMSSADPPPMPITTAPGVERTTLAAASTLWTVGSPGGATCTTRGSDPSASVTRSRYPPVATTESTISDHRLGTERLERRSERRQRADTDQRARHSADLVAHRMQCRPFQCRPFQHVSQRQRQRPEFL